MIEYYYFFFLYSFMWAVIYYCNCWKMMDLLSVSFSCHFTLLRFKILRLISTEKFIKVLQLLKNVVQFKNKLKTQYLIK